MKRPAITRASEVFSTKRENTGSLGGATVKQARRSGADPVLRQSWARAKATQCRGSTSAPWRALPGALVREKQSTGLFSMRNCARGLPPWWAETRGYGRSLVLKHPRFAAELRARLRPYPGTRLDESGVTDRRGEVRARPRAHTSSLRCGTARETPPVPWDKT